MTYKINTIVSYLGVNLRVIKSPEYRCGMCFFASNKGCVAPPEFKCSSANRSDNKSVTFIQEEEPCT